VFKTALKLSCFALLVLTSFLAGQTCEQGCLEVTYLYVSASDCYFYYKPYCRVNLPQPWAQAVKGGTCGYVKSGTKIGYSSCGTGCLDTCPQPIQYPEEGDTFGLCDYQGMIPWTQCYADS